MKTRTEKILVALKYLALLGGIGYSIECGTKLVALVASFVNLEWAKRMYNISEDFFSIREYNTWFFICMISVVIVSAALKALIWYRVVDLLGKLELRNPFSMDVANRLEGIAYILLGVWVLSIIGKAYISWLTKATGIPLAGINIGEEYIFIAGIVYVISKIFKRGIEIQEENQLTV